MDLVDAQRSQKDFSPHPKVQFPCLKQSDLTLFGPPAYQRTGRKRPKLWELLLLSYMDNFNDNSIELLHCW